MKTNLISLVAGLVLTITTPIAMVAGGIHPGQTPQGKDEYRLEGPFTQGNLTVFLIHGKDRIKGQTFITLQEALVQRKVIVRETHSVNKLSIENISSEEKARSLPRGCAARNLYSFVYNGDLYKDSVCPSS